ncbi:MAG: DGQHR domain-containing protein [Thermoplasmata archaeon]|nr:DGQHR domain-containing protein [Thermoplasmata archaeon]
MSRKVEIKEVSALEVKHHTTHKIWVFAYDPKEIRDQANIERMEWHFEEKKFKGYQRKIDGKHVAHILEYLDSGDAVLPNIITLALTDEVEGRKVKFTSPDPKDKRIRSGILQLPFLYEVSNGQKKGVRDSKASLAWVVDGQHRLEALSRYSYVKGSFPVYFSAIMTSDVRLQTELFARINMALNVKRELMERILAVVDTKIADRLALKQLAVWVREKMLSAEGNPFGDLIRR